MDAKTAYIRSFFGQHLAGPIRIPTACWLFSDLFGMTDSQVRVSLSNLVELCVIRVDNGGWIHVI